ncbi:hypothetical protein [Nocardioides aurantiacus]|uniref:Uncharacterized protein n=1 Tax=Nocardioides aurantiacus TaxID=86796 RepID=A0A3N2CRF5_9ACTN|nr:hypothetical protein [Nocardioides aurantiacus]ROR90115.1 hypothetical protein EDD33_0950 [Nocardioides aurantiacus]
MSEPRAGGGHELPRRPAVRVWGGVALVVLLSLVPLAGAVVMVTSGGWLAASGLALALLVLSAVVFLVTATVVRRTGRVDARSRDGGLELPVSRWVLSWLAALVVLFVVFALTLVANALSASAGGPWGPVVLVAGVLGLGAPMGVRLLRGDYQRGGLLLTPREVVWSTYDTTTRVAWKDLVGERLVADPGSRLVLEARSAKALRRTRGPQGLAEQPVGGPRVAAHEVSVPLAFLGSDGALVADLVAHYRTHPAARRELSDPETARLRSRTDRAETGSPRRDARTNLGDV